MSVSTNEVVSATKWSLVTTVLRKLVTPITNMVLARLLTPDAFGVVATINMVISFADMFSDAGFQKYLVQHEFDSEKDVFKAADVAFWSNFLISIILWCCIVLFKDNLASLVGSDGYGVHLAVASLTVPLLAFSSIQQSIFKRYLDFKGMFVARMVNALVPLIITIPLAMITRNCWALIIGTLALNISDAVLLTIKSKWKPSFYYSFLIFKRMLSFSIWTLFETLSIWLTTNIDIFILGNILNKYYLGLYKTSITSVGQITTLITGTAIPVLFSALSREQNDDKAFFRTLYMFQNKCAYIIIPMSIGMFMYRDVVTLILLGKQWMEASFLIGLQGLMEAGTILIANFASEVYRSKGEPKVSFLVQIVYIVFMIPSISVYARKGFVLLCIVKTLLSVLFIGMNLLVLIFRYKFNISIFIRQIKIPCIASAIMGAFAMFSIGYFDTMFYKLMGIVLCIIIYIICLMFFGESRTLLKGIFDNIKQKIKINRI